MPYGPVDDDVEMAAYGESQRSGSKAEADRTHFVQETAASHYFPVRIQPLDRHREADTVAPVQPALIVGDEGTGRAFRTKLGRILNRAHHFKNWALPVLTLGRVRTGMFYRAALASPGVGVQHSRATGTRIMASRRS